jgi:type II secretory pathway pseudopilin PulG
MEYSIHFLQKKRGMSLIEIMLVIAVGMGLMAGLVTIYQKVQNSIKRSSTQSLLFEVQNGLEEFRRTISNVSHPRSSKAQIADCIESERLQP